YDDIRIDNNPILSTLQLPLLAELGGGLALTHNNALVSISLPALQLIAGDLVVTDAQTLNSLLLPALITLTGSLTLSDNPAFLYAGFPAGFDVLGTSFVVINNAAWACSDVDELFCQGGGTTTTPVTYLNSNNKNACSSPRPVCAP
ncbi:MAG: hypothetical protein ACO3JL_20345, partial [Myxococcota bacterium]